MPQAEQSRQLRANIIAMSERCSPRYIARVTNTSIRFVLEVLADHEVDRLA